MLFQGSGHSPFFPGAQRDTPSRLRRQPPQWGLSLMSCLPRREVARSAGGRWLLSLIELPQDVRCDLGESRVAPRAFRHARCEFVDLGIIIVLCERIPFIDLMEEVMAPLRTFDVRDHVVGRMEELQQLGGNEFLVAKSAFHMFVEPDVASENNVCLYLHSPLSCFSLHCSKVWGASLFVFTLSFSTSFSRAFHLQAGKFSEIGIKRHENRLMFQRQCRQLGIGNQPRVHLGNGKQSVKNLEVACCRHHDHGGRCTQPCLDLSPCLVRRQWEGQRPGIRGNPKKSADGFPRESYGFRMAKILFHPPECGDMLWEEIKLGIQQNIDVHDFHRCSSPSQNASQSCALDVSGRRERPPWTTVVMGASV